MSVTDKIMYAINQLNKKLKSKEITLIKPKKSR